MITPNKEKVIIDIDNDGMWILPASTSNSGGKIIRQKIHNDASVEYMKAHDTRVKNLPPTSILHKEDTHPKSANTVQFKLPKEPHGRVKLPGKQWRQEACLQSTKSISYQKMMKKQLKNKMKGLVVSGCANRPR